MAVEIHYQKLIAYALLGYIEAVRRMGVGDVDINAVFGPLGMIDSLEDIGLDESIIASLCQIDEFETLVKLVSPEEFDKSIGEITNPILSFLGQNSVSHGYGTSAIRKLLSAEQNVIAGN